MLEAKDAVIGKAAKVLHFLSSDPNTVRLAELREKAIWDEVSNINGARAEGAKQREMDIARKMLTRGDSIEDVADMTDLSAQEVSKLRH